MTFIWQNGRQLASLQTADNSVSYKYDTNGVNTQSGKLLKMLPNMLVVVGNYITINKELLHYGLMAALGGKL